MLMDPCDLSPSYVRSIAPYQPGKPISELAREMGLEERSIVKLASNENPRGIGPRTRAAVEAALGEIARYPDGNGFELKQALAKRYGLEMGAIVLGNLDPAPTGRDRTSLVVSAENKPGAVHALLTPLAQHRVSMTRIESRPARTRSALWEYMFFIDVDGHQQDASVAKALAELKRLAPYLKVLGSYPAAN